jgi:L-lysine 2,3-aminomutase
MLAGRRLKTVVVVHVNHPRELGLAAEEALARLARSGLTLLNQSVLLAGVNDCPDILASLSERLFACGVLPYYLHQLDPVQGAAHFLVSDPRALELLHELRTRLPGYLVPRLVRELAGESFKRPLG